MDRDETIRSLIREGRKIETGTANRLDPAYYDTVLATMDYFGASAGEIGLARFDLCVAKYKIYDWIAMALNGRYAGIGRTFEKFAAIYLAQRDVGGWAQFLAGHDLDFEEPHRCEDCISTYAEVTQGAAA